MMSFNPGSSIVGPIIRVDCGLVEHLHLVVENNGGNLSLQLAPYATVDRIVAYDAMSRPFEIVRGVGTKLPIYLSDLGVCASMTVWELEAAIHRKLLFGLPAA